MSRTSALLPRAGAVQLAIFNLTGQRVKTLVEGPKAAGSYRAVWDGRDSNGGPVASGLYLCRLQVGQKQRTNKMLLVR